MARKILTVSIAAYNVSQYIRKTLDSLILNPHYMERLEVIIVNDGSTDDTLMVAKEYVSLYPDTFRIIDKENGGYGSTINASLKEAKGEYYRLLDGDDWYDKDGVMGLIDFLNKTDAELIISPYYKVKTEKVLEKHHPEIPEQLAQISSIHLDDKLFQMHGITVKTETLRKYGHSIATHCFYTDIEYVFYCIAASETIVRYNKAVYNYRLNINGQSVSRAGIQKHYKDHVIVTDRICKCYEKECLNYIGGKKDILDYGTTFSIFGLFNCYMILNNPLKYKKQLQYFDNRLLNKYPSAYKTGNASNVVRMTRRMRFHFYGLLCLYMRIKFNRF